MITFHEFLVQLHPAPGEHRAPRHDLADDLRNDTDAPRGNTELYAYLKRRLDWLNNGELVDELWLEYLRARV